jgi:hypothetical protein
MTKNIFLAIILIFATVSTKAQTITKAFYKLSFFNDSTYSLSDYGGKVNITEDTRLEQTISNFSTAFKSQPEKIYRVQIYFGMGRKGRVQAQSIKSNFEAKHPGIIAKIVFQEPYFKVRVGEFRKRIDAERLKAQLVDDYDKIFIIEDKYKQ